MMTFSKIDIYKPTKTKVTIFGQDAIISNIHVLHSSSTDFDGLEGNDYILTFALQFDGSQNSIKDYLAANAPGVDTYLSAASESLSRDLRSTFFTNQPDQPGKSRLLTTAKVKMNNVGEFLVLAGYFHYGWTIQLRLERAQAMLKLSKNSSDIHYSSDEIIQQRVRLINIKRRFLSVVRSNDETIKAVCAEYRHKFNMDERFESLNAVHEFLEHHLDNTSKVLQFKKTRALSRALNLLTFMSIPLGVVGTVLAIDFQTSFFDDPNSVASSRLLWILIGGTFTSVLVIVGLARLFDSYFGKKG